MKDFWNERYSEEGLAYGVEPNEYLVNEFGQIPSAAKVLVVGDGEGRNGVWLAQQGCEVTAVDFSHVAVGKIEQFANDKQVSINVIHADLNEWDWPHGYFDVVVSIYVHFPPDVRAQLHHKMIEALKPNGKIIMEAFNKSQLGYSSGGPPVEEMLFSEQILKDDFSDVKIHTLYETVTHLKEGKYHQGDGAVVRMIAEKIA